MTPDKRMILVIDDDPQIRTLLQTSLTKKGAQSIHNQNVAQNSRNGKAQKGRLHLPLRHRGEVSFIRLFVCRLLPAELKRDQREKGSLEGSIMK
jgi:hypothetical protein